jgi:hypothetical protein
MTDIATHPDMTSDETAELARLLAELHASGYQDVHHHLELRAGARIRHGGHQWPEAYTNGTGTVLAVTRRPDSTWSRQYGLPDVELVALWDQPRPFDDSSRLSQLAQYHVEAITQER